MVTDPVDLVRSRLSRDGWRLSLCSGGCHTLLHRGTREEGIRRQGERGLTSGQALLTMFPLVPQLSAYYHNGPVPEGPWPNHEV